MQAFQREPRYNVDEAFPLSVFIQTNESISFKLQTMSLRGCGIYVSFEHARRLQKTVGLQFRVGERKLKILGEVQYCQHGADGRNFIGIHFIYPNDKAQSFIQFMVERGLCLKQLEKQGFSARKEVKRFKRYHRVIKIV